MFTYPRWVLLGVLVIVASMPPGSFGQVVTFEGLVPGSSQTTYTEGAYTFSSTGGSIFVGFNSGAVTSSPFVFASNVGTSFNFNARPFDLLSIDLGPLNDSVGPQSVTFIGTLAGGGTVSQSFTTGSTFAFQTFTFDSTFSDLTSLSWSPGLAIADNISAFQGPTITFDGLTSGSSQTTYSEDGFTVTSTGGSIFVGDNFGAVTTAPMIFPSIAGTQFTLMADDGSPFDLFSLELGPLNSNAGPQEVTFIGTLLGGGTVSASLTTGSEFDLRPFGFGAEFSNLTSVTWTPGVTITDNIVAAPAAIPEPGTLASLGLLAGVVAFRKRRPRSAI